MEAVTDFIFLGSKNTVDCNFNHEIKKQLLLARKAMTNLDNILKNTDITLTPNKIAAIQMYACFKKIYFWSCG